MKKSKLSIGLVSSFIAAMALSACGSKSVTSNKENIVDFKGYDDEPLSVKTDKIYEDYLNGSTGISKYYDQVMEVLIRNAFKKDQQSSGTSDLSSAKKNYNAILNEAKDNVRGAKNTAKQNAETNGTSYKTEWQAILSSKGVKNEQELLESYIYDLEKEVIEDWYYEKNRTALRDEFIGTTQTDKAPSKFPYHVRHILIKVEDGASDYVRGTISADQAKLLSSTVELLAQGTLSFGEVAKMKSEDGSASSYGDLDIMTNSASGGSLGMVNEFQLGIYAYDAIIKNGASTKAAVNEGLGLNAKARKGAATTVKAAFGEEKLQINEIPYSVFKELGDVAELEANYDTGLSVEDGKAAVYPRNLLWNRYLNNHGIFVITNGARDSQKDLLGQEIDVNGNHLDANGEITTTEADYAALARESLDTKKSKKYFDGKDDYVKYDKTTQDIDYTKLAGFKEDAQFANGANEKVLKENKANGEVIIGVRSQYGIHLMLVQKSAYADNLDRYYTTTIPTDNDYEGVDKDGNEYDTYVGFITTNQTSDYTARADKVKSAIKGYDSTYDYRLYEYLTDGNKFGVSREENSNNDKLFDKIDEYIQIQRDKNNNNQTEGMEKVWQTYVELLDAQYFYRHEQDRVIPEGCKIGFTNKNALTEAEKKAYEEGGACYVK